MNLASTGRIARNTLVRTHRRSFWLHSLVVLGREYQHGRAGGPGPAFTTFPLFPGEQLMGSERYYFKEAHHVGVISTRRSKESFILQSVANWKLCLPAIPHVLACSLSL